MEEKVINHFCHEHPLILTENVGNKETLNCYGCLEPVTSESAYVCGQEYCSNKPTLHKKCGEMPRLILHPSHPQHPLHLSDLPQSDCYCNLCRGYFVGVLRYRCSVCDFDIDISCQQLGFSNILLAEERRLPHQSHPHPLTLVRKPAALFYCDGCGVEARDMAYACNMCEFWIHKTCASLPDTIRTNRHPHHLSLAFNLPIEHRKFYCDCDVCGYPCPMACWVYYCGDCGYLAHVKCATAPDPTEAESSNSDKEKNDGSDLIHLPACDISKELIRPFIIRENGVDRIPADISDMPASISMPETKASFSLLFNYHKHPLSLVFDGPTDELMMICDVCIAPIKSPPYYNCVECKYFLHSTCSLLPETLSCPDTQLYGLCPATRQNHKFTSYTSSELDKQLYIVCNLCKFPTNGMVYRCEGCGLIIDVKCASLPTTIKHASHPQHKLMKQTIPLQVSTGRCHGCELRLDDDSLVAYRCTRDGCDFALDLGCVLVPQRVKHEWDKHPLLLTYGTSTDHPTDLYCDFCEEEMQPERWAYHCRECDRSFHAHCITAFNWRNLKFGRQFEFDHRLHPHPLTYNRVALKWWCDICQNYWYNRTGFECASCNYVMCRHCGVKELDKM